MKTKNFLFLLLFVIALVFLLSHCGAFKAHTGTVVKLLEVKEKYIVVENNNKEKINISIPKLVGPLLTEGETYFIQYEYTRWHKPKLVMIYKDQATLKVQE